MALIATIPHPIPVGLDKQKHILIEVDCQSTWIAVDSTHTYTGQYQMSSRITILLDWSRLRSGHKTNASLG